MESVREYYLLQRAFSWVNERLQRIAKAEGMVTGAIGCARKGLDVASQVRQSHSLLPIKQDVCATIAHANCHCLPSTHPLKA